MGVIYNFLVWLIAGLIHGYDLIWDGCGDFLLHFSNDVEKLFNEFRGRGG